MQEGRSGNISSGSNFENTSLDTNLGNFKKYGGLFLTNPSSVQAISNKKVSQQFDRRVTVYGGGAYGQVIANLFARAGYDVAVAITSGNKNVTDRELYQKADELNTTFSDRYKSNQETGAFMATADLEEATYDRGLFIYAAPTSGLIDVSKRIIVSEGTRVISVSKGLCIQGWEPKNNEELLKGPPAGAECQVFTPLNYLKNHPNFSKAKAFAVVAGPGFAKHIMAGRRFGLTIGCNDKDTLNELYKALRTSNVSQTGTFGIVQAHASTQPNSIEIMAAMKNVTAIACGIVTSLEQPDHITSVNLTKWRGIKEAILTTKHLAKEHERVKHTDFMLNITADFDISSTPDSRNCKFGMELVEKLPIGLTTDQILTEFGKTVEGIQGAHAVKLLTDPKNGKPGIRVPLINAVVDILQGHKVPQSLLDVIDQEDMPGSGIDTINGSKDIFRLETWPD